MQNDKYNQLRYIFKNADQKGLDFKIRHRLEFAILAALTALSLLMTIRSVMAWL